MKHTKCSWKKLVTISLLAGLFTVNSALGSGFAIYETSARGFAIGGANVGANDDASALYSNPAAITQLEGTQIMLGAAGIMPNVSVTSYNVPTPTGNQTITTDMNSYVAVAPHLYVTHSFEDISLGVGIFTPFGLKSDFDKTWPEAVNNYFTEIQTVEINPNIAYSFFKNKDTGASLSIAIGMQIMYADVKICKTLATVPYGTPAAMIPTLELYGDTMGYGWNAAIQWSLNKQLSFGLSYRSEVKVEFDDADADIYTGTATITRDASGTITLPQSVAIGLNYQATEKLNLGFQALWTGWSSYEKLDIFVDFPTAMGGPRTTSYKKDWEDTWRYSFGAEYKLNDTLTLRAGYVYDFDPVSEKYADFMVPSNDRQIVSIGAGINLGKGFTLDLAYGFIAIKDRTIQQYIPQSPADTHNVPYTAKVEGDANIFMVSLSKKF